MTPRSEELAAKFEAKHREFVDFVEGLTDVQWLTLVPNEERSVAALVHHIAWAYLIEIEPFHAMALGRPDAPWTLDALNAVNLEHASEFAECAKQETLDLLNDNAARTAAIVRSLTEEQLARSGKFLESAPERIVDAWVDRVLTFHIYSHWKSLRETLGLQPQT
jgi:hypothetical protein